MTDSGAMKIAARLSKMNWKMTLLVKELEKHPNGKNIIAALRRNGYQNPADAEDVIVHYISEPNNYVKKDYKWIRVKK